MGNSLYESIVAKLNVLVPMLGKTQVDIGLTRIGTDPFHVTAVQMAQALNDYILPRIQQLTQKTATIDLLNVAQIISDPNGEIIEITSNLPAISGTTYTFSQKDLDSLAGTLLPKSSDFDRNSLALREITLNGRTLLITSWLERNEAGEPVRVLSHITDQTLRQKLWSEVSKIHDQLEEEVERRTLELQVSEEKYRKSIEGAADAILIFNSNLEIEYANAAAEQMFGYTHDDFFKRPMHTLITAPRRDRILKILRSLPDEKLIEAEMEMLHRSMKTVPVELRAVDLGQGRFQAILRDITDRKISEAAIRQKEEHIRSILENLPVVAYDRFGNGSFYYISPNVEALWGYRPEEFLVQRDFWKSCLHPGDRIDLKAPLVEGRHQYRLFSRLKKDYIWINDYSRSESDANGEILRYRGVMVDVTQEKALQAQLIQAQKMETIGNLAAGIAHDFNNQLTGIMGNLELVLSFMGVDERMAEPLRDAFRSAEHCGAMTRSILTFGRMMEANHHPVNLNRVVEESVRLLTHSLPSSIHIKVITNPDLWATRANDTRIQQVLVNLAINARDAMPDGGTLMIETDNHTVDDAYCKSVPQAKPGRYVMISVGDTGSGIDPANLQRIFEPFFTTKQKAGNSGLGLATVQGIVEAHQGWTEVYSKPGEGSNFRIFLPITKDQPALMDLPYVKPQPTETVLIADDEESVRKVATRILQQSGYKILPAADGEEAIEVLRRKNGEVDVILLDWTMPRKMGAELLDEIRQLKPNARIILSSGYLLKEQMAQLAKQNVTILAKPYTASQLLLALRQALTK